MAGKKSKEKKKKGKKGSDGGHIAAAIMPAASILAVPRSPPLTMSIPDFENPANSGILTSTLLGRMFLTNDQEQPGGVSETDTSLYDYENAKAAILAAFMPTAMFAAVPRTPPAKHMILGKSNSPLKSAIIGSSLFSQWFGSPNPKREDVKIIARRRSLEVPSSPYTLKVRRQLSFVTPSHDVESLRDYEDMPMKSGRAIRSGNSNVSNSLMRDRHATLEMRAGPSGESLARSAFQISPGPVDDTADEISTDEFIDEPDNMRSSEPPVGSSRERLSSPVAKSTKIRKKSSLREKGPPRTSMQRFQKEDEQVLGRSPSPHGYSGYYKPRSPSPVTPRSPTPQPIRTPSPSLVERDGMSRSIRSDILSTSNSKLNRLEMQQAGLLDKVQQQTDQLRLQQQQLQQQYLLQQQLVERLLQNPQPPETLHEMGTLLQSTQSVTDATLQHQDLLVGSLQEHADVLMQEKEELQFVNDQLREEVEELRKRQSLDTVGSGDDVLIYRRQIQDLRDERKVLKSDIQRLNAELGRYLKRCQAYRDKFGDIRVEESSSHIPSDGVVPSWQVNWKFLSPLFMAYDEQMAEKDSLILRFEDQVENFKEQLEDLIKENERLHIRIEQSDISGPISMTEWRQLQEQCKLVLEENQLLMEQLDVQQNKAKDMLTAHVQEVRNLSKKVVVLESEKADLEHYNEELRHTAQSTKKQYESLKLTTDTRLGVEEHFSVIHDLKRNQDDEKLKIEQELSKWQRKVTDLVAEKKSQALGIEDLKAENKTLMSELRNAYKLYRRSQRKEALLQRLLAEVESKEQSATKYLNDLIKMAEKTVVERDNLVHLAENQQKLKKKTLQRLKEESIEKSKLTEKMKLQKLKLADVLNKAADRMKAQDKDFGSQRAEYEREMKHLRTLLREKDDHVEVLSGEKRQVEDDLETMWHVASKDNIQMRESLRKMARQLQSHKSLSDIIEVNDKNSEEDVIEVILNSQEKMNL